MHFLSTCACAFRKDKYILDNKGLKYTNIDEIKEFKRASNQWEILDKNDWR